MSFGKKMKNMEKSKMNVRDIFFIFAFFPKRENCKNASMRDWKKIPKSKKGVWGFAPTSM